MWKGGVGLSMILDILPETPNQPFNPDSEVKKGIVWR